MPNFNPGMAFWQGRDDAQRNQLDMEQNQRRNALADIAQQRQDTQWQQGQDDRQQEQKLRTAWARIQQAKGAPPEVQAQVIAALSQEDPEFGQVFGRMPPEQAIRHAEAGIGAKLGIQPQQIEAPYQISEQPGPYGSRIVTDNKRFQVVEPPRAATPSAPSFGRPPSGFRFTPDGQLEPIPGGPQDPNTKRDTLLNKSGATAAANLPTIVQNAENSLSTLDALQRHPGIGGIFGVRGAIPNIPGSAAADAAAIRDQVLGAAFLEAFNTLKGGGQITEVEGKKATSAITRLQSPTISLREAMTAIQDLKQVIRAGVVKAKKQAALGLPQGAPAGGVVDFNSL